jgi:DNA-binding transcriptional MerR regulator
MARFYLIHEFAELAGVTVKALHHYDRLGLLNPRRNTNGYRIYVEHDLERLEQIVALRFLGVPLQQIKSVLDQSEVDLAGTLRLQRRALEQKRGLLERAIRAIQAAEEAIGQGKAATPAMLKKIIRVIDMQNDIEQMKKYYSTPKAWEQRRRYYEEGPSPEWKELYRDIAAAFGQEPGSVTAQALADRWLELSIRAYNGDPAQQTDNVTAWMDRERWPPAIKDRITQFQLEAVYEFIQRAALCTGKKYFDDEAWAKVTVIRRDTRTLTAFWQARVDLFRDIEACLGEDPAGGKARELAMRWLGQLDATSNGDFNVKAGLLAAWADRRNWSATTRWVEEGRAMMNTERFEKAADFLDKAVSLLHSNEVR